MRETPHVHFDDATIKDNMRKYNCFHDTMISRYREKAADKGLTTDHISNEELFQVIDEWSAMSTKEETEEAVMDYIKTKQSA